VGILGFSAVFIVLLVAGMPIAFVMLLSSAAYLLASGNPIFLRMMPETIYTGIDVFVLMSIPFFLLTGEIMNRARLTDRLFDFANLLVGRMRGGLAQVNVVSSVLFAGVTGVALGDIASQGRMFIYAMERQGYDRAFSAAITASTALIGAVLPPATIIIIYCAVTNVSVGAMFAAAVLPGLLLAAMQMGQVAFTSWRRQYPKSDVVVTPMKLVIGFRDAFVAILMPIIIRGVTVGWFTPTEAAAICVIYSLFVGFFLLRTLKVRDIVPMLTTASTDTARLFFIIAGASAMSWVFAMEQLPVHVSSMFEFVGHNPIVVVLAINIFFLALGIPLDASIQIILFAPVVIPLAVEAGLHPVQLGIMLVINCVLGNITPPVGNVLFAVASIAKIGMIPFSKALMPFIIQGFILCVIIGLWPDLTLALPRALGVIK
jgi:tripartite ATP-independent transporter DctM subunit